ncbi:HD-GYP domain-containing protein [Rhodoferax sp.]|uniref:HD-GYP domain-containing protein n=1 Tax=Rhodoferax sp. TaxID=50421 RepID=UPI00271FA3A9|nr:two-component system response regulator [Rhodoferax sp.]MDO9145521.1 two-component system response regulator [Rhodoferax sp.]MDP3189824.1 two-component system response regulator [Rhodoferax sp.]MDP3336982.1 two-component system response regulator [Rhodoferax sp.]MDP3863660.1 two-component system response regulator [Rhodoferax sp.]
MDLFLPVKPTILVVDDSPANLSLLFGLLHGSYTVKAVNHGAKALAMVSQDEPDLILLDIMMPDINGYEVCRELKRNPRTQHIPVIFLTSKNEVENEEMGMALGAVDYITRPISPEILLSRLRAHLVDATHARTLRVNNEYLEFEVAKRARDMAALQEVTILALASLAEVRDVETGNHLRRTQHYIRALARHLSGHPCFSSFLSPSVIDMLFKCAPLHDIGKVGIPDRILLKPGRYEPHEFEIMKTHPRLGYEALMQAQVASMESLEFIQIAKQIVYSHHEKWDGSGYPQGLVGDAIPIPARLMALADVYDALISRRVYKDGMDHDKARAILVKGRGKHFDPDVVDAFLALEDEFRDIAARYADSDEALQKKAAHLATIVGN